MKMRKKRISFKTQIYLFEPSMWTVVFGAQRHCLSVWLVNIARADVSILNILILTVWLCLLLHRTVLYSERT